MSAAVAIAAMGFAATVIAAWVTARSQRTSEREVRILEAKVRVYGACSDALYEYARATLNRVKARIADRPDEERENLRQAAYRGNTKSRSAVGQVAILTGDEGLRTSLEDARRAIGNMNHAADARDLERRRERVNQMLEDALGMARADLSE